MESRAEELSLLVPPEFFAELESLDGQADDIRRGRREQREDDGILAQMRVLSVPGRVWKEVLDEGIRRRLLTTKEIDVLNISVQIPMKIPSDRQAILLLEAYAKLKSDGLELPEVS
jgi:hypothetical protein